MVKILFCDSGLPGQAGRSEATEEIINRRIREISLENPRDYLEKKIQKIIKENN